MCGIQLSSFFQPLTAFLKSPPEKEIQKIRKAENIYIRGDPSTRSPCPFLNSLANHGYLPRDGTGITQSHLKAALLVAADCTPLLADVLSSIVKPLLHEDGTFTLLDLRKHNVIEHDASFTRLDYRQCDNFTFQPAMFQAVLEDAQGGPITRESLARTRVRRDKECERAFGYKGLLSLGPKLYATTWSQTCILLQTFGARISVKDLMVFYTEERLPDGWPWTRQRKMGFAGLLSDIVAVYWKHLFVKVPDSCLRDAPPTGGW
ncbi:hypothetical protein AC578_2879 [Pseudocercospora eumusae]|uniref:Heme haloperoxidase family profile domain-containing protein n=1 Tax=Pseudocercospora eumusae TaxID=321146 RepID=A0A139GY42_9PEZI|nr:hypothetical protein AC578_2879 [Pseudocercospora eumusae]